MPIKLIVTDLDNTLLRRDKTLSACTVDVLNQCRARGIALAFATARPKRAVFQYLDILNAVTFDAMAFHNGAVIYRAGELAAYYGIEAGMTKKLALAFAGLGLSVSVEIDDRNYATMTRPWNGRVCGIS